MVRLVTIHARLHLHRQDRDDRVLRPDVPVAGLAPDAFGGVLAMTKNHEIGKPVDRRWRPDLLVLCNSTMAWQARLAGREACPSTCQRACMAACAREFGGFVSGMAEYFIAALRFGFESRGIARVRGFSGARNQRLAGSVGRKGECDQRIR